MEQTLHGLSSRYSIAANVVRGYTTASEIEKIQNKLKDKHVTPPPTAGSADAPTSSVTNTPGTHSLTYSLTHLTTYSLTHSLQQLQLLHHPMRCYYKKKCKI
jgi:hypothetical protein